MFLGARRWWREDRAAVLPYVVLMAIFPLTYYFTHSSMDYRQPIEPQILILVVVGIFGLRNPDNSSGTPESAATDEPQHDQVLVGA